MYKTHFINQLWCVIEILNCKVTKLIFVSICDVRSDSGRSFIVCVALVNSFLKLTLIVLITAINIRML